MNAFHRILIPVDFSINTEVAVRKAIELSTPGITHILLLHVLDTRNLFSFSTSVGSSVTAALQLNDAEIRLQLVKEKVRMLNSFVKVSTKAVQGTGIEQIIRQVTALFHPDLIVLGRNSTISRLSFFKKHQVSLSVGAPADCPVLTVKPGSLHKQSKIIVVPTEGLLSDKKLQLLHVLCRQMQPQIFLVTVLQKHQPADDHTASEILHTMQVVRSKVKCSLQHRLLHSSNKLLALHRFAQEVAADMLMVDEAKASNMGNWLRHRDITDAINPESHLQVLSIQPD